MVRCEKKLFPNFFTMPEKNEGFSSQDSQKQTPDLFEIFKSMSVRELSGYTMAFNIHLTDGEQEGILIGFMDLEPSPQNVKVLVDGDYQYWTEDQSRFVKAENRNWQNI